MHRPLGVKREASHGRAQLMADIVRRAEGGPLYAVETIRMLQDRGLLTQEGSRYVVTGDVTDLNVPETLHALVASRLAGPATRHGQTIHRRSAPVPLPPPRELLFLTLGAQLTGRPRSLLVAACDLPLDLI